MADLLWNKEFALEQTGGDEELLEELLTLFRESSASDLKQLEAAIAADNPAGVVSAAHSIKGASASLGIEAIRRIAMVVEADARKDSLDAARQNFAPLADLLEQGTTLTVLNQRCGFLKETVQCNIRHFRPVNEHQVAVGVSLD